MAKRIAFVSVLGGLLMAAPAFATIIYNNGAPSLTTTSSLTTGYQISGSILPGDPYWVSNSFMVANNGTMLGTVQLAIWFPTSDTVSSVNYCISTTTNCSTTPLDSGSGVGLTNATTVGSAVGFTLDQFTFQVLNQNQTYSANTTYWLKIWNAAVTNGGNAYWDDNGGVGCTGYNGIGGGCTVSSSSRAQETGNNSESFQISVNAVPEPGSVTLMASGLLLFAGFLRRRR